MGEISSLRNDYNRSEIQIVSHQYTLETLKNALKSHESRKRELETLNDHWEQSMRSLEYYNTSLESQFNLTQEQVLNLQNKLTEITLITDEEYKEIQAKCEDLKNELKRARSPSPVLICRSEKPQMSIAKQHIVSIETKPQLENNAKIVIVASNTMYINETTVLVTEKNTKSRFEFSRVIKYETVLEEVGAVTDQVNRGGNGCIINCSVKNRDQSMLNLLHRSCSLLASKKISVNIVEIIEDRLVNLLQEEFLEVQSCSEIAGVYARAVKNISRGKSHVLVTVKTIKGPALQILDLAEVSENQTLAESLSINSSTFYLEELMMNLSTNATNPFRKSVLTQKLETSLESNYFVLFLLQCENSSHFPILTFGARLEQIFFHKIDDNPEINRTVKILQRERNSNLAIMRLIEKARKDANLLKKTAMDRDETIKILNARAKGKPPAKITSLSPDVLRLSVKSRIPIPKGLKNS